VLAKDVVLAPLAALKESKGVYSVTLKDGRVAQVKVGKTSTTHAEILEGVQPGDELRLE